MAKTRQITLKGWGSTTNYFTNQNVSGKAAAEELCALMHGELRGYVKLPAWANSFRDVPESFNCEKVVVKAWYWRGNWSDPIKKVYARFYLPRAACGVAG